MSLRRKGARRAAGVRFVRAGKAIGGGRLTHVLRGREVIGTINETLGLFMVHANRQRPGDFTVHHTMAEAKGVFQ